jgi:hypothetical protein
LTRIKDLKDKQAKAATASTRVATQLETLGEEIGRLETGLQDEFSITFEEAEAEQARLEAEQAALLADAEEKLAKINL